MFGKLLDILFGKSPDIFDADGNIVHKFPAEKWKSWNNRFQSTTYDWRTHKGTERQIKKTSPKV